MTTPQLVSFFEAAMVERGRRSNQGLMSLELSKLSETLELAFFTGSDPAPDAIAEREQWARHRLQLQVSGQRLFLFEDDERGRLPIMPLANPWEVWLRPGEVDHVLSLTHAALLRALRRPTRPT